MSLFHTSAFSFELPGEGWEDQSMQRFLALDGETTFFVGRAPLGEGGVLEVLEGLSAEAVSGNEFQQLGHRELQVGALDAHEVRLIVQEEGEAVYYRFLGIAYYDVALTFAWNGPAGSRKLCDARADAVLAGLQLRRR